MWEVHHHAPDVAKPAVPILTPPLVRSLVGVMDAETRFMSFTVAGNCYPVKLLLIHAAGATTGAAAGVCVESGITAAVGCSNSSIALSTSMRPKPAALSGPLASMSTAVFCNALRISSNEASGFALSINATAPATCGDAIDVPSNDA